MFGISFRVNRSHWAWRPLNPRQRGVVAGLSSFFITGVALAAWLALIMTANFSVTSAAFGPFVLVAAPVSQGSAPCTVTWNAATSTATINWAGATLTQGACEIGVDVSNNGSGATGFLKNTPTGAVPVGLIFEDLFCGVAALPGGTAVAADYRVSLDPDASSPGTAYTLAVKLQAHPTAPVCP